MVLLLASMNDCVAFCDVFVCVLINIRLILHFCHRCRRYLLLLVMQTWECIMYLSDWLIVVYVCMVSLLASMNDCVAFCDVSGCVFIDFWLILHFGWLSVPSSLFYCFFLIFNHGIASIWCCINSDAAICCICCCGYGAVYVI